MRNYSHIDSYLNELVIDIYPQPMDERHYSWMYDALRWGVGEDVTSVLDIGCGYGASKPFFDERGIAWTGVTLGEDIEGVYKMDMSFLDFEDNSYDMIFARHILEHSPMPLLTLMEWHRVSRKWLLLVLPNPKYWGYIGRNHYAVMPIQQARWLLRRSGWMVHGKVITDEEFRFSCLKRDRISYEGYVKAPLERDVYTEDLGGEDED